MPTRPPRICPRCSAIITGRRCGRCSAKVSGYNGSTYKGRQLRALKLANDPMCQRNSPEPGVGRSPECRYPATEVDHILTVEERPDLRYVYTNLQSLCHDHHVQKTTEDIERLHGRTYGPPNTKVGNDSRH